ncbi:hypothetical protein V8C35DRAFT_313779 [Trichoderma chlorosporum]
MPDGIATALSQAGIPLLTSQDAEFMQTLNSYTGIPKEKPTVVALPTTSEQVATIVTLCIEAKSDMVVRGGGHDMFGRFSAHNAIVIDLRKLNAVVVSEDKSTVRVGGGVTASRVLDELDKQGLQVPVGSCGTVGFTSWCLVGGLGPYSESYGLGADQIVGAKMVDARGRLVDADERLLKGLRGGGGCLGVVVELTVKAYPLQNVRAGLLMYDSSNIENAVTTFFTNYDVMLTTHHRNIPSQLSATPIIFPVPGHGSTLVCCFVWNGPATEESAVWLGRVASLAPLAPGAPGPQDAVKDMTALGYMTMLNSLLPTQVAGSLQTASVVRYSPDVVASIAKQSLRLPRGAAGGLNMHSLRPGNPSCSKDVPSSVCPFREPHIFIEVLGFAGEDCSVEDAMAWALEARNEFTALDDSSKRTYLPLTAPEFLNLQDIYGDKLKELKEIKKEYDPDGVFKLTVPRLVD